jgi:hypothetical protein
VSITLLQAVRLVAELEDLSVRADPRGGGLVDDPGARVREAEAPVPQNVVGRPM